LWPAAESGTLVPLSEDRYVQANRRNWEERTPLHAAFRMCNLDAIRAGASSLLPPGWTYPFCFWKSVDEGMTQDTEGWWHLENDPLPLMFSLVARKSEPSRD
jgi:hypothetical protein